MRNPGPPHVAAAPGFVVSVGSALVDRVDKVFLTASAKARLDLSPGRLEDVFVLPTAAGRLGMAINLDAFTADLQVSQAELPRGQRA